MRPIMYGVLFVLLCVTIPSLIGFYHNTDQKQAKVIEHEQIATTSNSNKIIEKEAAEKETTSNSFNNHDGHSELVFTKEEAVEAVLNQFTLTELLSLYSQLQNGIDDVDKEKILAMLEERFTDEEIEALKVYGISELEKVLQ
ncbi:hypothetical protein [Alkalihalobacillus deserti]|uniref:hypothetical protein n=1 Tax=Alkalihalobacillus deserti TaxID=2879466 RepID=UPI001D15A7DF|nr:hypothetical protein [Alkalihalobacillus deserti]